jgi:hypothetical protein
MQVYGLAALHVAQSAFRPANRRLACLASAIYLAAQKSSRGQKTGAHAVANLPRIVCQCARTLAVMRAPKNVLHGTMIRPRRARTRSTVIMVFHLLNIVASSLRHNV